MDTQLAMVESAGSLELFCSFYWDIGNAVQVDYS